MPCTLERELGRGSNAIVYQGSYPDLLLHSGERHIVLVKELFPYHGQSAIYRDSRNRLLCTPEGRETWELHRLSFERGNRVHLRMLEKHPETMGAGNYNLNSFSLNGTLYTVLGYAGGRELKTEYAGHAGDLRLLALRMLGLLDALEEFHESGLLHLDIAPDNILLTGRGNRERVVLIDYNTVYDMAAPGGEAAACSSLKAGYSAAELRMGQRPSPASDLYAVAAVFFRCLTGAALTPFQMSCPVPPDVAGCACLREQPDTVRAMVRQLLHRGLQTLPRRRYQSVARMREAFQELLDRVDGVGVTHWALWESGRRSVERSIRENPSLAFLRDSDALFPATVLSENGGAVPAGKCAAAFWAPDQRAALLTASGGMGKTTAMLRCVAEQSRAYSPDRPAAVYISLSGWREGDPVYIHDRILQNLRFHPEQKSYADARHALECLLEKPLRARTGERPLLVLLLDGLNEAAGETRPLIEEIRALSHLPGVGLLVSSRGEESALPFRRLRLVPLTEEEVQEQLTRHGLLLPESERIRELLRTPLMLSVFLQSSQAEGRQLAVQTREELLDAYFSALLAKELAVLPEDTQERWRIDAAMTFVLPAVAGELARRGRALGDDELLPTVERCYRLFSNRILRRAFPQWIGHSLAIRGSAGNGEEWYGQLVHDLLWKRLGLLVRDEEGAYRISHQIIAEYLTALDRRNDRRIWRRRRLQRGLYAGLLALVLCAGALVYTQLIRPPPYSEAYASSVFTLGMSAYADAATQYDDLRSLVDCALTRPEDYSKALRSYRNSVETQPLSSLASRASLSLAEMEKMLDTGKVFSWSGHPLDEVHYRELTALAQSRWEEYEELVAVLTYVMENERGNRLYGDSYPGIFSRLIDVDADITAVLYQLVCVPHLAGADDSIVSYQRTIALSAAQQQKHLSDVRDPDSLRRALTDLEGIRNAVLSELRLCGAIAACQYEEETP